MSTMSLGESFLLVSFSLNSHKTKILESFRGMKRQNFLKYLANENREVRLEKTTTKDISFMLVITTLILVNLVENSFNVASMGFFISTDEENNYTSKKEVNDISIITAQNMVLTRC